MSRGMSGAMESEVVKSTIRSVWIVRLDIKDDPILAWTGWGPFSPTGTGDDALDGNTFEGLGPIDAISDVEDTESGSQSVTLELPGVDLNDDALRQIVLNAETWQFRQAWIWYGLLNETFNVIADPTRIKTGRMDQMRVSHTGKTGTVSVTVESYQAYAAEALRTRYSQQKDVDPTDKSQDFAHDLANKQPGVGIPADLSGLGGGVRRGFDPRRLRLY